MCVYVFAYLFVHVCVCVHSAHHEKKSSCYFCY